MININKNKISAITDIYKSQYCRLSDIIIRYKEKIISENEIVDCTYASKNFKLRMKDTNESVAIEKYDVIVKEEQVRNPVLRMIEQSYYKNLFKKRSSYRYEIVIPKANNEKKFYEDIRCYVGNYSTNRYGSYLIQN